MKKVEEIREKANYCLDCKIKPCSINGCPLGNDIPSFIKAVKEEDYRKAYGVLSKTTVLLGVCGRICPHMKQCQGSCIRGIKGKPVSIGDIEAFVFDKAQEEKINLKEVFVDSKLSLKSKKVAVIGGGPAGLTCSAFLAKEGVSVTIFEKHNYLGGILNHGIPEFRLSKEITKKSIDEILQLGIDVKFNKELGKNLDIKDLENAYDAIFLSFGANISSKMNIEGEELIGVYGGNELLENKNHPEYKGKIACVIGGGNVAIDCARTIKKMGAKEVNVIYRRAKSQMPAEEKEVKEAKEDGINFLFQNNIVKIEGNKKVESIKLVRTELIEKEGETRKIPVNIENSNYKIKSDYVIMALGANPEQNVIKNLGIDTNKYGNIKIDDKYRTSNKKIYAGGDLAGIKGTVAWASKTGREAAKSIIEDFDIDIKL